MKIEIRNEEKIVVLLALHKAAADAAVAGDDGALAILNAVLRRIESPQLDESEEQKP